ncbi:FadR/GntR family transcriptional regulator [Piscibacillus halophilus]|uniref:Regulatory protein, gntR family n=1 Tax=Piscibacillus halophilus TaxID=571933 RepID=A0A1H9IDT3_9BACI|nr:GntR family transcriptional regulator [Piscibacillus halophilus]SEQ72733.1 regulatory protein, gntR family [Piscibacillus halophilus]
MTNSSKIKVYQEVLEQIRLFIEEHELSEGDRLPSERELADQLGASRSSVREALRAIELLGLIETKHGEGTFLRTYRPYHSVELLATFVLRQPKTKEELLDVRQILEQQCIIRVMDHISSEDIDDLIEQLVTIDEQEVHEFIFKQLFSIVGNELLSKIWYLINNFSQASYRIIKSKSEYVRLLSFIKNKDIPNALSVLEHLYFDHD